MVALLTPRSPAHRIPSTHARALAGRLPVRIPARRISVHVVALAAAIILTDVAIAVLRVLAQVDLRQHRAGRLDARLAQGLETVARGALDRLPPLHDERDLVDELRRDLGVGDAGHRRR